jgi:glutathione peroxidase
MFLGLFFLFSALMPSQVWAASGVQSIYDITVTDINGQPQALSQYKGKVLVVVNTASRCGYTPQYNGLEALYERYKDRGLVVLGFPSNDFNQEPGDDKQIKKFCDMTFHVHFPLFDKGHVKGSDRQDVFQFLTAPKMPGEDRRDVSWNFEKFIVNRQGEVTARFRSQTSPVDPDFTHSVEKALKQP